MAARKRATKKKTAKKKAAPRMPRNPPPPKKKTTQIPHWEPPDLMESTAEARELVGEAFRKIQHPLQRAYLVHYALTARHGRAAAAADVERSIHYKWLADPEYADAFELSKRLAGAYLEEVAIHRAVHGQIKPIIYQGEITATVRETDHSLLKEILRAHLPERYGRNRLELTGAGGGAVSVAASGVLAVPTPVSDMQQWIDEHTDNSQPEQDGEA